MAIFASHQQTHMPHISRLFIYPIKSLGGIVLPGAQVTTRGLQHDRRWVLVDPNNRFMSQRTTPPMALFALQLTGEGIVVTHTPTQDVFIVPFTPQTQEQLTVTIWDDTCTGIRVSDAADAWFSRKLDLHCRLVYMDDASLRPVDPRYAKPEQITSFADAYPMLLIGEASLMDLNSRLTDPVGFDRFRPNIVISGTGPYHEDEMAHFSIGDIHFYGVKPCARCVMVGVNQQTAEVNAEPLKTLSGYRRFGKKVYLGQNLVHEGVGTISVGDELQVINLDKELLSKVSAPK
ncbi:MOSC N-terminal beta barrel domain-containing protein [Mucilaginibacter sp. CSA2-8R]|uniref:MOSC domain-containing protein n=1 Tax=Mucilaginibacter sp. CSA2-8R TaxID=3141542 RepID=UPI00315C53BC